MIAQSGVHAGEPAQLDFSPDGRRLVVAFSTTGLEPCEAQVYDVQTMKAVAPPMKHGDGVAAASFSADGKWILTASEDNSARVWSARTSEPRAPAMRHTGSVYWAEFSPDGRLVLTASRDGTGRVWDAATGQPVTPPLRHGAAVRHASFAADALRFATASEDKTARVWELVRDPRLPRELLREAEMLSVQRVDETGGLVPLTMQEIEERWQDRRLW